MTVAHDSPAAQRWHRLVTDRLEELRRLSPAAVALDGAWWDRRAGRYAANIRPADTDRDPFLRRLRRITRPSSTVIDVGAGTGRFALALADGVSHVAAVDPSAGMLDILRRDAARSGLSNVTTTLGTWEQAEAVRADVAFSAFVLTLVADARPFVTKLDEAARRHALLYLGAYCADAVLDPLWRHFHGTPRSPGPSYLDALDVLRELGIAPAVKVVAVPDRRRFTTIAEAAEHYREALLLDDSRGVKVELEGLLSSWLLGRRGALRSPLAAAPAAIIRWQPGAAP